MEELQLQINSLQNQINNLPIQNKQKFSNTTINTTETVVQRGGIQSAEFSTGATGWRFDADGNLEANAGHFRGDVTGASGTFSGVLTGGSLNIPDITSAPSFHVDNTGNTWWGAAAIGSATASILNTGVVDFVSGNIAGWNLSTSALSTGAFDTLNTMYFGASGLSLSNVFKVTDAGVLTAKSGTIGGTTITDTKLYGGIIQTSATVGAGSNGVIMDTAGLRGYDSVLGKVFDIHTDGSAPEFAFGNISNSIFEINTNAILRTSTTVGDGSASSAGILINDTGLYACETNQTLANANVKILIDGSAVIKMNVKGGQTDFNTGIGYFLGLSGGDYKFSIGNPAGNYMTWDGQYLKIKGSFNVGDNGLINNSVYTVANLPVAPTVVGFNVPSAYE